MKSLRRIYRNLSNGQCAILLYHRVTNYETDPQLLAVTPDHFDDHLRLLKKKYQVLRIDELEDFLIKGKNLPSKCVAITFDDGYADNYIEALPILEKNLVQALFYICTGNLNTKREFWWDEIERTVLLSSMLPAEVSFNYNGGIKTFSMISKEERVESYNNLLPLLRSMRPDVRDIVIRELTEKSGSSEPRLSHRSMTFDELNKLAASDFAVIGAHSHNHPSLAALTIAAQRNEINSSKKILEESIGKQVRHFSYPFGTWLDYNIDTIQICKESGFKIVAANYPDTTDKESSLFSLPRFLVRDWNEKEFEVQVSKFFSIL